MGVWAQRAAVLVVALLLSACASTTRLRPFTSDGCSLFPDRALAGGADWCHCCLAHDLAYWRGGTADERLAADERLRSCVAGASGRSDLGDLMFNGVRAGGGPSLATPFRWGYGWSRMRAYGPLSPEDDAQASALLATSLANRPAAVCQVDRVGGGVRR